MISIIAALDASAKNSKIVRECKGDEAIARLPDGGKCVTRKVPSKTKDIHFFSGWRNASMLVLDIKLNQG